MILFNAPLWRQPRKFPVYPRVTEKGEPSTVPNKSPYPFPTFLAPGGSITPITPSSPMTPITPAPLQR
jgi:hypothetical protein